MKEVLKKAVISEKSFAQQEDGKYVFYVDSAAIKNLVAREVERLFKVDVLKVRIINIPGKVKRLGRIYGKRSDTKKAIVKIKKDQKIEEFKI